MNVRITSWAKSRERRLPSARYVRTTTANSASTCSKATKARGTSSREARPHWNCWANLRETIPAAWARAVFRRFRSPKQIHLRCRRQLLELVAVLLAAGRLADVAFGGQFGFFEVAQNFLGAFEDAPGHASQAGDLDAVAFVRAAFHDL